MRPARSAAFAACHGRINSFTHHTKRAMEHTVATALKRSIHLFGIKGGLVITDSHFQSEIRNNRQGLLRVVAPRESTEALGKIANEFNTLIISCEENVM